MQLRIKLGVLTRPKAAFASESQSRANESFTGSACPEPYVAACQLSPRCQHNPIHQTSPYVR
jgi:hypothetical protein